MNEKPKPVFHLSRPPGPRVSIVRIATALLAVMGIGFACIVAYGIYDYYRHIRRIEDLIPLAILLILFYLFWGVAAIFRYRGADAVVIPFLFTVIIIFGFLAIWNPELGLQGGAAFAKFLILFIILYRLPFLLFLLLSAMIVAGFIWVVFPLLLSLMANQFISKGPGIPPLGSILIISVVGFILALAYFPRGVEWKRYFFPTWKPAFFNDRKDEERGVTLIEVLIGVAVLGIMTGSLVHVWSTALRTQKEVELRAHVVEILNSQMDVLMAKDDLSAPSGNPQPLPIGMAEFVTPFRLNGHYLVEKAGEEGLVKITVRLEQDMDAPVPRHFRLVAYRRAGKE